MTGTVQKFLGLFALLNKALMAPFGWPDIRLKNTVG
jgi:hypothetical protein